MVSPGTGVLLGRGMGSPVGTGRDGVALACMAAGLTENAVGLLAAGTAVPAVADEPSAMGADMAVAAGFLMLNCTWVGRGPTVPSCLRACRAVTCAQQGRVRRLAMGCAPLAVSM